MLGMSLSWSWYLYKLSTYGMQQTWVYRVFLCACYNFFFKHMGMFLLALKETQSLQIIYLQYLHVCCPRFDR